jgi:NADH-quinone oxidoreductase subunit J
MTSPQTIALGTALAAVGIWWLLPGSSTRRRTLGGVLAVLGFGCLGAQVPAVGDWFTMSLFHAIAAATIVAAVATISFRSPVYCAIWFGMTLTGTAGLFLMAGAEFLAVATLVVYAGAILVTFLFVLMLSQPEGHTSYDRRSWEPMISAFIGAVLVGILTTMIGSAINKADKFRFPVEQDGMISDRASIISHPTPLPGGADEHAPPTISHLGAVLFTRYLVAVEAAGALLFAALVGAAVIVTQGRAAMKRPNVTPQGGAAHAS